MPEITYPKTLPRNAWLIHLESGIIHAESIVPPIPTISRGDSASFEFRMYTPTQPGRDPPPYPSHLDRYEALLKLNEHAGSYVDKRTVSNSILYEEQLPTGADSLLVKLEPAYETPVRGVWGLLDGVDDASIQEELIDISISVFVIADADEYETRTELESDLSYGGP